MDLSVQVAAACAAATFTLAVIAADATPRWAVDPQAVGEPLPAVGRSLFDFLVTEEKNGVREYNVPFPYTALIQKIEQRLHGNDGPPHVKQVLIPLGRSLQRNAAAPDFFQFPRVVAAIDTEATAHGDQSLLLKDRVYIGFGEKSAILEVISYNEAAARFEFQVVNDYRPGGTPRVAYADRAVCMSCHQNAALVFSRQNWDESNANPEVARLLKQHGDAFHGVAVEHGVDVPFAIDVAARRANLFAVTQLLWRVACGEGADGDRCRATVFGLALQYRLSGERGYDASSRRTQQDVAQIFVKELPARWPGGLLIPDPTIPNRNPLQRIADQNARSPVFNPGLDAKGKKLLGDLLANTDIPAPFEPLNARAPLETWPVADTQWVARLVSGLAEFIAVSDAQRIDARLSKSSAATPSRSGTSSCSVSTRALDEHKIRVAFRCDSTAGATFSSAGRLVLRNGIIDSGEIESLEVDGSILNALELGADSKLDQSASGWSLTLVPEQTKMRVRTGSGSAINNIVIAGRGALNDDATAPAAARVSIRDDFAPVWKAIDTLLENHREAFSDQPFRRAVVMPAVLAQLGEKSGAWCCVDTTGMPPLVDDRLTPVAGNH